MAAPRKDGKPSQDWNIIIPEAARYARSYEYPPSLRRVFYQLVAAGTIYNTPGDYNQLCTKTAEARRAEGRWHRYLPDGFFPDLDDSTRELHRPARWTSGKDYAVGNLDEFRLDRDEHLPFTILIGVEKRGIVPYLRDWFHGLGLFYFAVGGYHSVPFEQELCRVIQQEDREAFILFAGDHDASGDDIVRNLTKRVPCADIRRVGLTKEQVASYGLINFGGKEDDTRWPEFALRHGYDPDGEPVQVELDALALDDLQKLYVAGIAEILDLPAGTTLEDLKNHEPFVRARAEEEQQLQILKTIRTHWDAVEGFLSGLED